MKKTSDHCAQFANPNGAHGREIFDSFQALDTNGDGVLDRNETSSEREVEKVPSKVTLDYLRAYRQMNT